jgi:DNA repair protein RadD
MSKLRPYQIAMIDKIRRSMQAGNRKVLAQLPTGGGKTLIASEIMKLLVEKGNKAIFVADRRKLIDQTSEKLKAHGVDHGLIMAGRVPDWDAPVQVASIQTLASRAIRNDWIELPDVQLLCFDEAHKSLGPSYFKLIEEFYPSSFLLGLTATPIRSDGRGLGEMYDDLIMGPSVNQLVDEGFLVPMKYFAPSEPDMEYLEKIYDARKGDYNETKLGEYMENNKPLIGDIVQHYLRIAGDRQAVVFASSVRHSIYLAEAFNKAGVAAEHIDGTTYHLERERIYADVHSGKIRVLTNCAVLIEGWDEPQISAVILARPTKSVATYLQMAGRVLRPYPGKVNSILIDHSGAVRELGFVDDDRPWSLNATKVVNDPSERHDDDGIEKDDNTICEECSTVYRGRRKCPNCGWEPPKKQPKPSKVLEAELEELHRAAVEQTHKLDWYERALGYEKHRRLPAGWADRAYRMKFKVAEVPKPTKVGIPDKEMENWHKYMIIREKYSKMPRKVRNG